MDRPSDRRATRLFSEAIVCGKMNASCDAERQEDRDFMSYVERYQAFFFFGVVHQISTILVTTGNQTGIAIIDLLMYYFWGYFFVTAVKNLRRRCACGTFTFGLC